MMLVTNLIFSMAADTILKVKSLWNVFDRDNVKIF